MQCCHVSLRQSLPVWGSNLAPVVCAVTVLLQGASPVFGDSLSHSIPALMLARLLYDQLQMLPMDLNAVQNVLKVRYFILLLVM